ncbi:GGDEF domain-containing protein [Pyruvatibacter sp.]|uniref:GGDEF domain-containing protein n=1 Tax=Pyruvatibacter sp. TaxID=1981328 RepID=UPI0032ECF7B5
MGWFQETRPGTAGIGRAEAPMKVDGTRRPGAVSSVRGTTGAAKSSAPSGAGAASAPRHISDTASIMGIPEAELTPKVRDALMTLMSEVDALRRELTTMKGRLDAVQEEADTDSLVPVLNRRAFVRELSRMISFSQRYNQPASLVFIDLNNFKQVNDKYGHAAGDAVLEYVASALVEHVRESDIVGRLGGDEFAVILAQATERDATDKAESLMHLIADKPLEIMGHRIAVSVSPGAVAFKAGEDAAAALARADEAMYAAKRRRTEDAPKG